MGLVNPGILQQQGGGLLGGIQQGQGIRQNWQQGQDQGKARQAMQAFQTLAQGQDITTREGLTTVLKGMTDGGFGDHALKIFAANQDLFKDKAAPTKKFGMYEGAAGPIQYEESDPSGTAKPFSVGGVPVAPKPDKPAAPKEWDPLGQAKLDEQKRHNKAMEAKAAFDAKKAADKATAEAGQTKLTEAQSKIVGAAGMAKVMLDDVANQFKDSKLGGMGGFAADVVESIPLIGGKMAPKTNEYNDKRRLTAETFLREATGAAAPAPEIKFYTNLLPEGGDSPEQAQSALDAFRGAVMAKVKGVATTLRAQGKDAQANQLESKMQKLFDSSVNIKEPKPAPATTAQPFQDPNEEAEYQAWKKAQGQ